MLAVFTVSVGFGVNLPLLPFLIERLLESGGDAAQVSRATGLVTGLYMLSLFVFAPVWGRLSDRFGRRTILLIGLVGFSAVTFGFAFIETLPSIYAERILSGLFAAAVTPVALATIEAVQIDLAIIDLDLPGLSGIELVDRLRVIASDRLPVLVVSDGTAEHTAAMRERRIATFVQKPFYIDTLIRLVRRLVPPGPAEPA